MLFSASLRAFNRMVNRHLYGFAHREDHSGDRAPGHKPFGGLPLSTFAVQQRPKSCRGLLILNPGSNFLGFIVWVSTQQGAAFARTAGPHLSRRGLGLGSGVLGLGLTQ